MYLGKQGDQRRQRRFFVQRSDAEKFVEERNKTPLPIGELWDRKAEILYNLERLRPVKTSLTDVATEFLAEKKQIGRSHLYDSTMRYSFGHFIKYIGGERRMGDISRQEISDYIYVQNKHVRPITKRNLLTNLSVLFNFAVRRDYVVENPLVKIDRPTVPFVKPHVLSPSDFEKLLQKCFVKNWHDRLVLFVLVGFCGIRVEEASKLRWSNLQLHRKVAEVPDTVAKKSAFRNNVIPPNAMEWLRTVEDKRRTGPIIGKNWRTLLRSAIRFCDVDYQKNCIRHSFCSYALAVGWSLADVISYMGHGGSPTMVFSHYRNVVSVEDGKRWFSIVP